MVLLKMALALLLGACATPPPPPFVLELRPTSSPLVAIGETALPVRVEDMRVIPDRRRIGEVYAPGGGRAVPPAAPATVQAGAIAGMLLMPTQPTGRYLYVADSSDVARAVERALIYALLKAGRRSLGDGQIEVGVRSFWIRPSWTTTCDIAVDVRLSAGDGTPRWETAFHVHADEFEGWFTTEAFERVATIALDRLVDQAAEAFESPAFRAVAGPDG